MSYLIAVLRWARQCGPFVRTVTTLLEVTGVTSPWLSLLVNVAIDVATLAGLLADRWEDRRKKPKP